MNYTKKLQLGKPDENEYYDINVINHNMDILDGAIEERTEQEDIIKTAVSGHMDDTDNPHAVTKEQIGLEKVPNVATNDQAVTYEALTTPTALLSGERLSVAFGKLAGAVADYIMHKANIIQRMMAAEMGINDLNKNFSEQTPYKRVLYDKAVTLSTTTDNIFNCTDSVASYDFIVLDFTLSSTGKGFQKFVSYVSQNFYITFEDGAIKKRMQWVFSTNFKQITLRVLENSGAYDIIFKKATGYRIPLAK